MDVDVPWDKDEDEEAGAEFNLSAKAFDVKLTRQLASEITQKGASMYDALGAENELREDRLRAISRNMDIEEIEQQVGGRGGTGKGNEGGGRGENNTGRRWFLFFGLFLGTNLLTRRGRSFFFHYFSSKRWERRVMLMERAARR